MSYLVLARKWRPKRFAELVGQEHVVRALSNALDTGRIHHAFLFTGTRGVGKTTIARIFAKSLNCQKGTSADPCGQCAACLDIDAGRYIDLLEIDAASNTGVDDVREVIENAQYMPSRGKFKVYLIDEVHMLSKAAFNALLKTLEEPPEHVKFLLATTDPQKLPVTVLSRCLQFNLKRLEQAQIGGQIGKILDAEGIQADEGAIRQIAKAADGSLRDGLSLLDQAIAYAGGALSDAGVRTMLGTVDRNQVGEMLEALAEGDGERLLQGVSALAEFSPDWDAVLEALAETLHRIQVRQLVPGAGQEDEEGAAAERFAAQLRPEVVQLWYQMALGGRRDLPLAPSARAGFEMSVLRMLAFRPASPGDARGESVPAAASVPSSASPAAAPVANAAPATTVPTAQASVTSYPTSAPASATVAELAPPWPEPAPVQVMPERPLESTHAAAVPDTPHVSSAAATPAPRVTESEHTFSSDIGITHADVWMHFASSNALKGAARQLVENAAFVKGGNGTLHLSLEPGFDYLRSERSVRELAQAIAQQYGVAPKIMFQSAAPASETLRERTERERDQQRTVAEQDFMNHPDVQRLMQQQGAKLVPDSIRPFQE